jgi:predicted aldo/keto reductase-like oxidoreductase
MIENAEKATPTRREFLTVSLAGVGICLADSPLSLAGDCARKRVATATDQVALGCTGIRASRLAQGTGFRGWARGSDQTRMGQKDFDRLIHHGLNRGINFFDAADSYGSHPYLKKALGRIPRERYVLLTKLWPRKENWITPSGGAFEEVERFRKELDTDIIDVCLLHMMLDENWPAQFRRVMDELSVLKQRGKVRALGVSCHDLKALKQAATQPWVDVILARINHKGGKEHGMDGSVEEVSKVLKQARSTGKAVVGMKVFGGGSLTKPDEMNASLRYLLHGQLVDALTIGMTTPQQIDDTIERINRSLQST